jgi:hypothetical protein
MLYDAGNLRAVVSIASVYSGTSALVRLGDMLNRGHNAFGE